MHFQSLGATSRVCLGMLEVCALLMIFSLPVRASNLLLRSGNNAFTENQWPKGMKPPAEHPEFVGSYDFLSVLHADNDDHTVTKERSTPGQLSNASSWWSMVALLANFPSSLHKILPNKEIGKKLGEGSFGVTYLARDLKTNELVAIKILKSGGERYLTPRDADKPGLKELVDASKDECQIARGIHAFDSKDPEGSRHVMKCLKDGITETLSNSSLSDVPLYLVLEFAGASDLNAWWLERMQEVRRGDVSELAKKYRMLMRQLIVGLNFMNNPERDVQWIHHDLKPQNVVVDDSKPELKLSIIDLGTALSTQNPKQTSPCTVLFRPPEFISLQSSVGFASPAHSFDTYSAALSMISLLTTPIESKGADGSTEKFFLPQFVQTALMIGVFKSISTKALADAADCLSRSVKDPAVPVWVDRLQDCLSKVTQGKIADELDSSIAAVRRASGSARKAQLMTLIGCAPNMESGIALKNGNPLLSQIVDDWMSSKFDDVLLQMLSPRPDQRPQPLSLLESAWLQQAFQETKKTHSVEYECPPPVLDLVGHLTSAIVAPILAIGCCGFCTCFGMCCCVCHTSNGGQSAGWTACVLALCVAASGMSLGLWIDGLLLYVGMFVSLGTCLFSCCHGQCKSTFDADQHMASTWIMSLRCSVVYCLVITVFILLRTMPLREQLGFAAEQLPSIFSHLNDENLILLHPSSEDMGFYTEILRYLKSGIILTMYPTINGFVVASFGLWRWSKHRSQSVVVEPGLELRQIQML